MSKLFSKRVPFLKTVSVKHRLKFKKWHIKREPEFDVNVLSMIKAKPTQAGPNFITDKGLFGRTYKNFIDEKHEWDIEKSNKVISKLYSQKSKKETKKFPNLFPDFKTKLTQSHKQFWNKIYQKSSSSRAKSWLQNPKKRRRFCCKKWVASCWFYI